MRDKLGLEAVKRALFIRKSAESADKKGEARAGEVDSGRSV